MNALTASPAPAATATLRRPVTAPAASAIVRERDGEEVQPDAAAAMPDTRRPSRRATDEQGRDDEHDEREHRRPACASR
jgi:hypothetical protein